MQMPELIRSAIPPVILQKLINDHASLERNGRVEQRCEPGRAGSYRLRYRGPKTGSTKVHQLSITLPSAEVAFAVRQLLMGWQNAWADQKQQVKAAETERRLDERDNRELRREWQRLAGGGRRRKQRIGKEFDQASEGGVMELAVFALSSPHLRANQWPGRPIIPKPYQRTVVGG